MANVTNLEEVEYYVFRFIVNNGTSFTHKSDVALFLRIVCKKFNVPLHWIKPIHRFIIIYGINFGKLNPDDYFTV